MLNSFLKVVDYLSDEPHMQQYPEREELMISLLDLSEGEMKTICTAFANTLGEKVLKKKLHFKLEMGL